MKKPTIHLNVSPKKYLGKDYSCCLGVYNSYYTLDINLHNFPERYPKKYSDETFLITEISNTILHEILHYTIMFTKSTKEKWKSIFSFYEEKLIYKITGEEDRFDPEDYTELIRFDDEDEENE